MWCGILSMGSRLPSVDFGRGVNSCVHSELPFVAARAGGGNGVVWGYGWIPESSDVLLETKKHRSEMWSLCTRLLTKAP